MFLGSNIKSIRRRWRENQTVFSARFGMTPTNISRIEAGEHSLSLQDTHSLSKLVGVSMERLIEEELQEEEIPLFPIGEGGEMVTAFREPEHNPKQEKNDSAAISAMAAALAALAAAVESERAAMESERAENAAFRKKMELLEKKLEYLDGELLRLSTRNK